MADIIQFPQKLCAMCGESATIAIDLVDEYDVPIGKKYTCDGYPFCNEDYALVAEREGRCSLEREDR